MRKPRIKVFHIQQIGFTKSLPAPLDKPKLMFQFIQQLDRLLSCTMDRVHDGWTITSPSEELLDFIIFQGWQDIQMGERLAWSDMAGTGAGSKAPGSSQTGAPKPPKAKSSTRRWVCPKCGTLIRSTKEVRVICADCIELFVKAD